MAFQAVPDTAEIDHIFTLGGVTVQNVHYAERAGGYTQSDLQDVADAIDTVFAITYVTEVCDDVAYVKTEVRGLAFENDLVVEQNAGAGVGTHVGNSFPNNVTIAIKKLSGLSGRSARGRSFWIGVPRNETIFDDENRLEPVYVTQIVDDIQAVRNLISGLAGWNAVLVSRFTGGSKRPAGVTFDWADTVATDNRLDTQRARLPTP